MIFRFGFGIATTVLLSALWAAPRRTAIAPNGVPVKVLVTAGSRSGGEVAEVHREDVIVYQGHERDKVADWVAAKGDRSGFEIFVLIDDASNSNLGLQLDDVRPLHPITGGDHHGWCGIRGKWDRAHSAESDL